MTLQTVVYLSHKVLTTSLLAISPGPIAPLHTNTLFYALRAPSLTSPLFLYLIPRGNYINLTTDVPHSIDSNTFPHTICYPDLSPPDLGSIPYSVLCTTVAYNPITQELILIVFHDYLHDYTLDQTEKLKFYTDPTWRTATTFIPFT